VSSSRFSSSELELCLQAWGVETVRCDLLDPKSLSQLPEAPNVVYMAGMKIWSTGQGITDLGHEQFFAGTVSEKYRNSRIAAFSTGNVYGLSAVSRGGSREDDPLNPVGEYAMSLSSGGTHLRTLSRTHHVKMSILRLNYATELRYGVLLDVAQQVVRADPWRYLWDI